MIAPAPLPPGADRARPRAVRRQRHRRGDARRALPTRPPRRRRRLLVEPGRPRLRRVLRRHALRADGQARRRALRGGDQRFRPQPAHAPQRAASAGRTSTSCRAASTRASTSRPPSVRGSDRAAEVLFVGRLLHGKGLSLLLEADRDAARARPRCDARPSSATGPRARRTRPTRGASASTGTSRFHGAVGQDEIRAHYARADLFCLPSFAEGVPVVAMEAMAMELPVVSTRIMGIPELVGDGEHGLLVAPGRADVLTDALERLVRAPQERRRMGRAAREKVRADYDVARSALRMRARAGGRARAPPRHRRTPGARART